MDQVTKSDITEARIRARAANDAYEAASIAGEYLGHAKRDRAAAEAELRDLEARFAAQQRNAQGRA